MPNPDKTYIAFVLDRSGSMSSIRQDAIGGFNTFIEEQRKEPGECSVSVHFFNTTYETLYAGVPLAEAALLTEETFVPSGMTALFDAVGMTIDAMGAEFRAMKEEDRPGKILVVIVTDGAENSSKEYTRERVAEMIKTQQDTYSWNFMFLAANIDTDAVADSLHISKGLRASYSADSAGVQAVYSANSRAVSSWRNGGGDLSISTDDVEDNVKKTPSVTYTTKTSRSADTSNT